MSTEWWGRSSSSYGTGVGGLTLADRATISNMSPEFGATSAIFPIDDETLRYLRDTGRPAELLDLVERYTKEQGLFRTGSEPEPAYSDTLDVRSGIGRAERRRPPPAAGSGRSPGERPRQLRGRVRRAPKRVKLGNGSVAIAAITSCTNTSNPALMVAAGLVAQKAVARGLGGSRGSRPASRRDHGW